MCCTDDEVGDDGLLDDEEDGQVEEEAEDGSFEHDTGKSGESGKAEQQKQQDGENASGNTVGAASVKALTDAEVGVGCGCDMQWVGCWLCCTLMHLSVLIRGRLFGQRSLEL